MYFHRLMLGCVLVISGSPLLAATAVSVRYHVDGTLVARMTYSGGDGWKAERYWGLLAEKPWFAYDVAIEPDEPNGRKATLEGRVLITLEAAGVERTSVTVDSLQLVRPEKKPKHWHPTAAERDRLLDSLRKQSKPMDDD